MADVATDEPMQSGGLTPQKQALLITFYRTCWEEMTWRRNAGYRTVILGFGYLGAILAVVAFNRGMPMSVRACLGGVIALGTLFGGGYLASNYYKYMGAMARMVRIEQYVGAYDSTFLGTLGALMPAHRIDQPKVPLSRNVVCIWSVLAFVGGGILTAVAIVLM
jgi:hypothetical protein